MQQHERREGAVCGDGLAHGVVPVVERAEGEADAGADGEARAAEVEELGAEEGEGGAAEGLAGGR